MSDVTVTFTREEAEDLANILDWEVGYDEGAEPEDRAARQATLDKLHEALGVAT